ncbi:hypothetical protein DFJ73DRAFT_621845 [Zopfochytrium polystomum]|nr:hypothetical protein DFJ73DRAFT_621845 [Zopfochytrium polystomum]
MPTKPAIAFFGATGGCTAAALALALEGGYLVSALARTPSKLRDILAKSHVISESTIDRNLVIVQGDVKDVAAVRKTLTPNNRLVDIIVSGIGGTPVMQASLFQPVSLNDPSICADAARTVVQALSGLPPAAGARRPTMIAISTTGTDLKTPDVPFLLRGLYHWLLAVPHIDKRQMEDAVVAAYKEGVLGGFVVVRPTLLVDGDRKGSDKVRAGWVPADGVEVTGGDDSARGPAVGYSISRKDVGGWVFDNVIQGSGHWENRCVSLTY